VYIVTKVNYYNEIDPRAAQWLRSLIAEGLIPEGHVDTRSITEVTPNDLRNYTQCHFFTGIGGWSLALQLAGIPSTTRLWTGSCPCQPFSTAGKGLAQADERHLWPVFFNLIRQCRPELVFGEQVASAIGKGWLDGVSTDLESENYACGATVLGSHSVGAPHIRQRLYWVAYSQLQHERSTQPHGERAGDAAWMREAGGLAYSESIRSGEGQQNTRRGFEGSIEKQRPIGIRGGSNSDWQRVIHSCECDEFGNCPVCEIDYSECGCPGPTQDDEYEYRERDGILEARRLVQSNSDGRIEGSSTTSPARHGDSAESAGIGDDGMCDTEQPRLEGLSGTINQRSEPGRLRQDKNGSTATAGFWTDYRLAKCRDGKTRRIPTEPAFFPLAHGIPARVVRLRGYGNAIVPQVAAEFIRAFYEVQNTQDDFC